jgi:hypothetical protein
MSDKPIGRRHHSDRQLIFDDSTCEDEYVDYELDLESLAASVMDVQRREDYWIDPLPYRYPYS